MKQFVADRWQLILITIFFIASWYFYYLNCCGFNLIMDYCQVHYLAIVTDFLSVVYVCLGYPVHMYMQFVTYLDPRPGFVIFESKLPFLTLAIIFQFVGLYLMFRQWTAPVKLRYAYLYPLTGAMFVCFIFVNTVDFVNKMGYQ